MAAIRPKLIRAHLARAMTITQVLLQLGQPRLDTAGRPAAKIHICDCAATKAD
jgi:hypothetical protein